ncbi:hypothetical protein [Mahella australiensis]|uniref:hypothetical protein n=1 Tax=Mahella australiensis TaxID=252966 RepID=UPI0014941031|nr:hypothetical protein [Mahella australiensis]
MPSFRTNTVYVYSVRRKVPEVGKDNEGDHAHPVQARQSYADRLGGQHNPDL